jgi:DNA-binding response OmpR family regulator
MERKKVLIIEDDAMIRDFLCEILRTHGFEMQCCIDAESALAMGETARFDIVITDFRLPGMNGGEAARLLRDRGPQSFIIGMSSERKADTFRDAGADCFLQKPFSVKDLVAIVGRAGNAFR